MHAVLFFHVLYERKVSVEALGVEFLKSEIEGQLSGLFHSGGLQSMPDEKDCQGTDVMFASTAGYRDGVTGYKNATQLTNTGGGLSRT